MRRFFVLIGFAILCGCGGDGTEADQLGVGAECGGNTDCNEDDNHQCLPFKGGYCGVPDCDKDDDCPDGSRCVTHSDSENYCFLVCSDKAQCNANRTEEQEANCSSSVDFLEGKGNDKACVPPS